MDQHKLFNMLARAGYSVIDFQDHPQYFHSWRATISLSENLFQIVSDGRESWLELKLMLDEGKEEMIKGQDNQALDDDGEINIVEVWLNETKPNFTLKRDAAEARRPLAPR